MHSYGETAEICSINPLNAELNPICHLLALLAHPILHISGIRVKAGGMCINQHSSRQD
jgi:hypothetical protein